MAGAQGDSLGMKVCAQPFKRMSGYPAAFHLENLYLLYSRKWKSCVSLQCKAVYIVKLECHNLTVTIFNNQYFSEKGKCVVLRHGQLFIWSLLTKRIG